MFRTLTAIARHTPDHRPEIISILKDFYTAFHKEEKTEEHYSWMGWARCIADIGASELSPLVRNVFDAGGIDSHWMEYDDFDEDLGFTMGKGTPPPWWNLDYEHPEISSAIDELSWWQCFSEEYLQAEQERQARHALTDHSMPQKIFNDGEKVGRNDPCPCGSGLKFKKCCL